MVTPILVPAIGYQPIWASILSAPSHNLDCMPTKHWVIEEEPSLVHSRLVCKKALVYEEHSCDGAILVDILHHGVGALRATTLRANAVTTGAAFLRCLPSLAVVNALTSAARGRGL